MSSEPPQQLNQPLGPSLLFIYFMIGFVLGGVSTMIILSSLRPFLPLESPWIRALVFAPLLIGVALGARVAGIGKRERLPLSAALWRALGGRG